MNSRWFKSMLVALLGLTMSASAMAAGAVSEPMLLRFIASNKGKSQTTIEVEQIAGGKHVTLAVPNDPVKKGQTDPLPKRDIMLVVDKLQPGNIIHVAIETKNSMPTIVTLDAVETHPGEDTPNGYVFAKTYDKQHGGPGVIVVLTKFGEEHKFDLITKKDDKGKAVQDPDLVAAIGKLTEGGAVWIQTQGKLLSYIEPYAEPETGKITKIADKEVDGHKVPAAEVETDAGKQVTLYVPMTQKGKVFVADHDIKAQLGKLKVGSHVAYRAKDENGTLILREITIALAKAPAAPEPTTPAKPTKKPK